MSARDRIAETLRFYASGAAHRIGLGDLRVKLRKRQCDVAAAAGMDQADVSRLEAGDGMRLSTLRRYAKALGGELAVSIVIGDRRYEIDL